MLRLARAADIPRLIPLVRSFHEVSNQSDFPFVDSKAVELIKRILADTVSSIGLVTETQGRLTGCLAGIVADIPFSTARVASEIVWWGGKRDLLELFNAYLYWAREVVRCDFVSVGDMDGRLSKFYSKRGFIKKEETWLLSL